MEETLPKMMKAAFRTNDTPESLVYGETAVPTPRKGELLIKVMASPVNPSDEMVAMGLYGLPNFKPTGEQITSPGLEGAGIVVLVGPETENTWVGKRVGMFCESFKFSSFYGCWAQYTIKRVEDVVEIPEELNYIDGCYLFVNPLTVMGFWRNIVKDNHKAVIASCASSSLIKQLYRLCKSRGVEVIPIVRTDEHVKDYELLGCKHALNQTNPQFMENLRKLIGEMRPSVFFDALGGGELAMDIFRAMPPYSHLYCYGGLAGEGYSGVSFIELCFGKKQMKGYWLSEETLNMPYSIIKEDVQYIANDILAQNSIFKVKIVKEIKLSDFTVALQEYKKCAKEGKLVVKPWD